MVCGDSIQGRVSRSRSEMTSSPVFFTMQRGGRWIVDYIRCNVEMCWIVRIIIMEEECLHRKLPWHLSSAKCASSTGSTLGIVYDVVDRHRSQTFLDGCKVEKVNQRRVQEWLLQSEDFFLTCQQKVDFFVISFGFLGFQVEILQFRGKKLSQFRFKSQHLWKFEG